MATGGDYVTQALEEIGYFASETPIEPDDMKMSIRKFNDMMAELDLSGTEIGFTPLASEADEVRLPRSMKNAIVMNLAGRLAGPFKIMITPAIAASIKSATNALLLQTVKIGEVKRSGNLPKGTGNTRESYFDETFYPDQDKENF